MVTRWFKWSGKFCESREKNKRMRWGEICEFPWRKTWGGFLESLQTSLGNLMKNLCELFCKLGRLTKSELELQKNWTELLFCSEFKNFNFPFPFSNLPSHPSTPCNPDHSFSVNYLPYFIILIHNFYFMGKERRNLKNIHSAYLLVPRCSLHSLKKCQQNLKIIMCDLWIFFGWKSLVCVLVSSHPLSLPHFLQSVVWCELVFISQKCFFFAEILSHFISIYTLCHWNVPCLVNELCRKTSLRVRGGERERMSERDSRQSTHVHWSQQREAFYFT